MRKIAVFTGTRAEYGLLYWVIKGLQLEKDVDLQLFVGGMHLSREFGFTVEQIEADGFNITERLDFLLSSDSSEAIAKSMALALMSASEAFNRHRPDLLVILGDRFEAMAIAQAAMILRVPIAHIHGGETTEGVIDEAVRHSISKMAHLHFTATESYRKRVIQLGEHPNRVFNVGAPGIDSIKQLKLLTLEELSADLGFKLNKPYFVVTFHPVTLMDGGDSGTLINLISALNDYPNYKVLISYPNADADNGELIKGKLGQELKTDEGYEAAKRCGLSIVSQVKKACNDDLSKIKSCIKLTGFVNSTKDFIEQPKVINGASDLIASIFGDAGMHTRAAVSTNSLPLGVSVEVDAIFELN